MDKNISFTLKVWRQAGPKAKGAFETYQMKDIPGDTSFLEMLDILNEQLISERKEPVVFDDDSREAHLITGMLDESLMDKDEKLFQQLWKTYFKAICIKERMNPRKHKQDMPVRYWKYLTEKQKVVPLQIKTDF